LPLADGNYAMDEMKSSNFPPDNGGRRSGIERRRFEYTSHIPERRSGRDRRKGHDRRRGIDRRTVDRRQGVERRIAFLFMPGSSDR
jgi:hypothetical protein